MCQIYYDDVLPTIVQSILIACEIRTLIKPLVYFLKSIIGANLTLSCWYPSPMHTQTLHRINQQTINCTKTETAGTTLNITSLYEFKSFQAYKQSVERGYIQTTNAATWWAT